MEKLVISHVLVVVLLFSGMCAVPRANAQRRCYAVLDPKICYESKCVKDCVAQHLGKEALGMCQTDASGGSICLCYWDC
ncbi:hypothetical protein BT93_H1363 [Corymbia citriodora subsp. variegata]|nr:hypothetical protein BT93_H1363 [Corymbia citriodora subsp. variegata]